MDFIVGLPRTRAGYDSICVVVDRLTNMAHFITVKTTYNSAVLAELYIDSRVCFQMRHLLENQGRASETRRFVAAIADSSVEMG